MEVRILHPSIRVGDVGETAPGVVCRATPGSAGYDVYAAIDVPVAIPAGKTQLIPLGIAIWLDDPNWVFHLMPRSKNPLRLANTVGVIDSDYQGQIFANVWNDSYKDLVINPLDKIGQLVMLRIAIPDLANMVVTEEFLRATGRGEGGINAVIDTISGQV